MIVTPNGVRLNGFVKTNGQISNGHVIFNQHDASDTSEVTVNILNVGKM